MRASRALPLARPESLQSRSPLTVPAKWLLRCRAGGSRASTTKSKCVYIPDTERGTLVRVHQVGCTLNCTFCHTGTQRLVRNLRRARSSARSWWRATT